MSSTTSNFRHGPVALNLKDSHSDDSAQEQPLNNTLLMEIIMTYLEQSQPFELPTIVQQAEPQTGQWPDSILEFSPTAISAPPPSYTEYAASKGFTDESQRSPVSSVFSESSSYGERDGSKTPLTPIDPLHRALSYDDFKCPKTTATTHNTDFYINKPLPPLPEQPLKSSGNPTSPMSPVPLFQQMECRITNLIDIMPEYMPEFLSSPAEEMAPMETKISSVQPPTKQFPVEAEIQRPISSSRQKLQILIPDVATGLIEEDKSIIETKAPAAQFKFPHISQMIIVPNMEAPKAARHSAPASVLSRKVLKNLEAGTYRSTISFPTGTKRHATKVWRRPHSEDTMSETVSVTNAVTFGADMGVWFTRGFFTGSSGLTMKMSRRVVRHSKVEWVVEDDQGAPLLRCSGQANSFGGRTGKLLSGS